MKEDGKSVGELLRELVERWNALTPIMIQMGIIEDLLNRKVVVAERGGEAYTLTITSDGILVEDGENPYAHARMCTTYDQWKKIFKGQKTYATIFRFELHPQRDSVPLQQMALVERFSTVMQALVNLPQG